MSEQPAPQKYNNQLPLGPEQEHGLRLTPFPDRLRPPTEEMVVLYGMLRESSAIQGDSVDIYPVTLSTQNGEVAVGYEIRLFQNRENFSGTIGNDWVFYDFDDSLTAYSRAKAPRQANYNMYLKTTGLSLVDEATAKEIMDVTDKFARWDEQGGTMYHIEAHMQAVAWATKQMRDTNPQDPASKERVLTKIRTTLERIDAARQQGEELAEDDPFYLQDGLLIGRRGVADDEAIEEVFAPMIDPEPYLDVIESVHQVKNAPGEPKPDVGVFTYGEPIFQLTKTLRLMERAAAAGKPLPFASIFLTTVSKGDFMTAIVQDASRHAEQRNPYFNTARPHIIALVDDDPSQLAQYEDVNRLALLHSEGGVVGLRLRHDTHAKTANREWPDTQSRTQRAVRYTYDENGVTQDVEQLEHLSGQKLTDAILWTLIQGPIKPQERAELGHEPYYDDRGYAEKIVRAYGNRAIIKMFPRGSQGDIRHVYEQWGQKATV